MKKLFFIAAITLAAVSCKKSSPTTDGCAVNAGTIAGMYTITSISFRSSSTEAPTDIFSGMIDCEKDASYELKADGTAVISREALDCGTPPAPGTPSAWALDKNNTVLIMGADLEIQSFDCKKLVLVEKISWQMAIKKSPLTQNNNLIINKVITLNQLLYESKMGIPLHSLLAF